jgi:putative spermidine/putrescine transport system permease protein
MKITSLTLERFVNHEPWEVRKRLTRFSKETFLLWPLLLFLLIFFFYPLLKMAHLAFFDPSLTLKNFSAIFETDLFINVLIKTLKISFLVTLTCLVLAYPLAYLISDVSDKIAIWLITLVLVPFWTSILIRTYAWMVILGYNGVLNNLMKQLGIIESSIPLMYNLTGVIIGMVHILLPFMVLPLFNVMDTIDKDLLKAAQSLGANNFKAFWKIFFPLSLPGVGAGCLLVFIMSMGFFITPSLMGGRKDIMISMLIELQVTEFLNWGIGSAMSLILLAVIGLIFFISSRYLKISQIWGIK